MVGAVTGCRRGRRPGLFDSARRHCGANVLQRTDGRRRVGHHRRLSPALRPARVFTCLPRIVLPMGLLSFETGPAAHQADDWAYGGATCVLLLWIVNGAAVSQWPGLFGWALVGLGGWSLAEYGLHRFVLHRVQPFAGWHARHHARPTARIATPTLMSAMLFVTLVFLPAWWLAGQWPACALTLGMVFGYFAYGVTHGATHHAAPAGLAGTRWLRGRRRWHARHHQGPPSAAGCYGVTTGLWDHVFGTALATRVGRR